MALSSLKNGLNEVKQVVIGLGKKSSKTTEKPADVAAIESRRDAVKAILFGTIATVAAGGSTAVEAKTKKKALKSPEYKEITPPPGGKVIRPFPEQPSKAFIVPENATPQRFIAYTKGKKLRTIPVEDFGNIDIKDLVDSDRLQQQTLKSNNEAAGVTEAKESQKKKNRPAEGELSIGLGGPVVISPGSGGVLISVIVTKPFKPSENGGPISGDSSQPVDTVLFSGLGGPHNPSSLFYSAGEFEVGSSWMELQVLIDGADVAKYRALLEQAGRGGEYLGFNMGLRYDIKPAAADNTESGDEEPELLSQFTTIDNSQILEKFPEEE